MNANSKLKVVQKETNTSNALIFLIAAAAVVFILAFETPNTQTKTRIPIKKS